VDKFGEANWELCVEGRRLKPGPVWSCNQRLLCRCWTEWPLELSRHILGAGHFLHRQRQWIVCLLSSGRAGLSKTKSDISAWVSLVVCGDNSNSISKIFLWRPATGWTVRSSNPGGGGGARFSLFVQTGRGAHPASYFPGGKAAVAWFCLTPI